MVFVVSAEPPSFEALVPRYIHDPNNLLCPTAVRWQKLGHDVPHGRITVKGKEYPVTYGFLWLASGNARMMKREGERAPLVACYVHRSVYYGAVYKSVPPAGDSGELAAARRGPDAEAIGILAVRRNGEVGLLDADEE